MNEPFYYRTSVYGHYEIPLERFLPPLARGVIADWFTSISPSSGIFLDGLGSNPMLPIEVAEMGRQVIVSRHNPVLWLMLETLASAPNQEYLSVLMNRLLLSQSEDGSLEDEIKALYCSTCQSCGEPVQPTGFIWKKCAERPHTRVYRCEHCGDEGERPTHPSDINRIITGSPAALTRARAFQRVGSRTEYEEISLKNAVDCYSTRALQVINALINRVNTLPFTIHEKNYLQCMLFSVFEDALSLWHWPLQRSRPLQLSIPNQFFEKNLWFSLIQAPSRWARAGNPVSVNYWPKMPDSKNGIILFSRRLLEKKRILSNNPPDGIGLLFAHPNQAFWTLSALWSGWLWGKKGSAPMRAALTRRHYDWVWYHGALSSVMAGLTNDLVKGVPVFGILTESTPAILLAVLQAMRQSAFLLTGHAQRAEEGTIQLEWRKQHKNEMPPTGSSLKTACLTAIRKVLKQQGEPLGFQEILTSVLCQLTMQNSLPGENGEIDVSIFNTINDLVGELLNNDEFVSGATSEQSGSRWWIDEFVLDPQPLSERVEKIVIELLNRKKRLSFTEIDRQVCVSLPALYAPSSDLIRAVLESYAVESELQNNGNTLFQLRAEEMEMERQLDMKSIQQALINLGNQFGFQVNDQMYLKWQDAQEKSIFHFVVTTTTSITNSLLNTQVQENTHKVLVLPGSRVRLLLFRLKQDARLAQLLNNWSILKFRYVRWLANQESISLSSFLDLLGNDPAVWDPTQKENLFK